MPLCAVLYFYALGLVAAGVSPQAATRGLNSRQMQAGMAGRKASNQPVTAAPPWQQLLALPSESDISRRAEGSIRRAQETLARSDQAPVAGAKLDGGYGARLASAAPLLPGRRSGTATGISVTIKLSPGLAERFAPQDTLYIFAKLSETSNHPLAIIRRRVEKFPARVTLDDGMTVMPTAKLSGARQFIVGAHISKSGVAIPRRGICKVSARR